MQPGCQTGVQVGAPGSGSKHGHLKRVGENIVLGVTYEGSKELNAVSMLTGVFFGMELDVPSERRNLGGTHRRHSGTRRACSASLGVIGYEVTGRRTDKIAFDNENGYNIVEFIAAKICCAVIDIDHEVLGGQ
jgi:hypothetical protein